jgi:hypothetical protein
MSPAKEKARNEPGKFASPIYRAELISIIISNLILFYESELKFII